MAAPRLYVADALREGVEFDLPAAAARHVQVLRLQPGDSLVLFDGRGGEWQARVLHMGRNDVQVRVGAHDDIERELPLALTLALGMPANDRMDFVVEKATELGVAVIQPLHCERSVLRLAGERASKKVAHWQAVAVAASEQSGRTRVPRIEPVRGLADWLGALADAPATQRIVLSLAHAAPWAGGACTSALLCLSGPEGGLTEGEEMLAARHGFQATSLGPRVLRADTAPLALLAHVALASLGGSLGTR